MNYDLKKLRHIPILQVANRLGINLQKTGSNTYAMIEANEKTSLIIFEDTNTWKRFSGKEYGGVSGGSTIDLCMHINNCDIKEAMKILSEI